MTSIPKIGHITIDCDEPKNVAHFWAAVFSTEIADDWGEFLRLKAGQGDIQLAFAKVPEGRTTKDRMHLDLQVEDREAETARLTQLGASHLQDHEMQGFRWTVMADVEGNEFCVAD